MRSDTVANGALVTRLWPRAPAHPMLRAALLVLAGSLLLTLSAKIKVPFYPVEMTMQTFVVLFLGAAYGWRLALASVLAYLAQGAAGLPVFTGTPERGLGLAYMMGPTGGYMVGWVFAVMLAGWLAERGAARNLASAFLSLLAANAVVFAFGLAWLGVLMGFDAPILSYGLYPFVLGDLLKTGLAAALLVGAERGLRRGVRP